MLTDTMLHSCLIKKDALIKGPLHSDIMSGHFAAPQLHRNYFTSDIQLTVPLHHCIYECDRQRWRAEANNLEAEILVRDFNRH